MEQQKFLLDTKLQMQHIANSHIEARRHSGVSTSILTM